MQTDQNSQYLLKAVDAFRKRFFVISTNFKVLAVNQHGLEGQTDVYGKSCFDVFFHLNGPCQHCPGMKVLQTKEPIMWEGHQETLERERGSCLYAYPIIKDNEIDAMVMMNFDLPIIAGLEDQLKRSNSFLRNLMLSSVDGVISADKNGKILIFNEAASEISGYSVEEALSSLDIRAVYPEDGAKEVMRKLRSEDFGGKGKLKSYQVDFLRKTGEIVPISLNAAIVYEEEKEVATIGYFHDLREDIEMKKELEKTQVQLLQAQKNGIFG